MDAEIKAIFDDVCKDLVIDQALSLRIHQFVINFINRNPDHQQFFGGHLLGVHIVRFVESDKNHWFDDILQADEHELFDRIKKLRVVRGNQGDGELFKVASDPLNQSCVWLCHKFFNTKSMTIAQRSSAIQDVLLALQFKFLTSRLYRHFKFVTDVASAQATYARLNNKYLIKQYGTWLKLFEARCAAITATSSPHFQVIENMQDDKKVVAMLNDIQGRIRDMLKNIYSVFKQVKDANEKISSKSSVVEFEGVEVLKDRSRGLESYTNYLKSIISDKNSFIRAELLTIIYDIVPLAPPKHVLATLEYISNNFLRSKADNVNKLIEMVMIHSFRYLQTNSSTIVAGVNLPRLLERLRGVYTASRSSDPDLLEIRELTESIVKNSIDTKTESVIASVRTAILLYLISRAYTMRHYTSI